MTPNMEGLITVCRSQKNIYIYGAGKNASITSLFLQKNGIQTVGFVVTDMTGNPEKLFGQAVISVDELPENSDYRILVPVARASKAYKEIFDHLIECRVNNAFFFTQELLERIQEELRILKIKDIFNVGVYRFGENIPVEKWHSILVMEDAGGQEYHWRFRNRAVEEQDFGDVITLFSNKSALEEFEEQYGRYNIFQAIELEEHKSWTCALYMAKSHADKAEIQSQLPLWLIPIQVGAALTEQNICKVKDNTGDNISDKNGNYSECTAIYWMWKNAPRTDYIGLCHYRRHFDLEENELGRLEASGIDVLLTSPTFVNETVETFFSILIPKADIKTMLDAIDKLYPEYTGSAKRFFASRFYPPCNLFIMQYELFQEYAEFVFSVTFEIEHFYDSLGFYRRDRYMGYLIECLLGIFLMKNKERLKIAYTDMRFYL